MIVHIRSWTGCKLQVMSGEFQVIVFLASGFSLLAPGKILEPVKICQKLEARSRKRPVASSLRPKDIA